MAESANMQGYQVIETNKVPNSVSKIIVNRNFNMEVQQHKVKTFFVNLKDVPFTNNSKHVPLAIALIHSEVRKLFIKEIAKILRQEDHSSL